MTRPLYKPNQNDHIKPTQRAWMILGRHGGPCDKECKHCYYVKQKQLVFFSLDTLMSHANRFRYQYKLGYVDMSGGDASIYGPMKDKRRPQAEALVKHCANIGLKPTIITHGQNNTAEFVGGIEDAGLEDWLISMHGMGEGHDNLVVNHSGKGEGGWQRLVNNLPNCKRPVRFNTTVQNYNFKELPAQAQWLADNMPATCWNMIRFNPFFNWAGQEVIEFQAKASEIAPYVGEAVKIAEAAGWEVNCRYFEPCVADPYGFARNCVGFFGTQIDSWEWDLAATNRAPAQAMEQAGGQHAWNIAFCEGISRSRSNDVCKGCRFFGTVCEGPPEQYGKRFGYDEFKPYAGEQITDPAYFHKVG